MTPEEFEEIILSNSQPVVLNSKATLEPLSRSGKSTTVFDNILEAIHAVSKLTSDPGMRLEMIRVICEDRAILTQKTAAIAEKSARIAESLRDREEG